MQNVKSYLVSLGPGSRMVRIALRTHGALRGFGVHFSEAEISLRKNNRDMILSAAQYIQVPLMMECYQLYFDTIEADATKGREVLDFSKPALHTYKRNGASFHFPSVREDDVMDAYTRWYTPKTGDVVWDAGAHAGDTTCFLAGMVGPEGKVYAFEPDECNFPYLTRNIELHQIRNAVALPYALGGSSGSVPFQSNGMDIEGAELAVISGAKEFLQQNPIHFAIESQHQIEGEYTCKSLDRIFRAIGYEVESSSMHGVIFTWARPK